MSSVERYDDGRDEWVAMDGLPRCRAGCVGFLVGSGEEREFWVMGGYGESRTISMMFPMDEYYKDAVVMDVKKNGCGKWRDVGDMWREGREQGLGRLWSLRTVIGTDLVFLCLTIMTFSGELPLLWCLCVEALCFLNVYSILEEVMLVIVRVQYSSSSDIVYTKSCTVMLVVWLWPGVFVSVNSEESYIICNKVKNPSIGFWIGYDMVSNSWQNESAVPRKAPCNSSCGFVVMEGSCILEDYSDGDLCESGVALESESSLWELEWIKNHWTI
ncbi:hypothetical protein GH714_036600 [Hevea brasiliensis]|uniref:Uncharacterized protein n=1 Tax=Hevea brasiliensis TaxID=3981 RepID=A0A6A6LM31_HEVBR|nr:hypothetical protein GH714_036600 [Hevea brasiliensis]